MSLTRYGNLPGQWKDDGPSTPVRLRRSFAVVMADTIPTMRPVVSNGGNYISGGGRPPAKAMHVIETAAEWRKREQNREAAQRYRERKSS